MMTFFGVKNDYAKSLVIGCESTSVFRKKREGRYQSAYMPDMIAFLRIKNEQKKEKLVIGFGPASMFGEKCRVFRIFCTRSVCPREEQN